jgi:hypothetical protein
LQHLLERIFNHYACNIGGFLCALNLYSACWRCSYRGAVFSAFSTGFRLDGPYIMIPGRP